jgi:hypothetical protein
MCLVGNYQDNMLPTLRTSPRKLDNALVFLRRRRFYFANSIRAYECLVMKRLEVGMDAVLRLQQGECALNRGSVKSGYMPGSAHLCAVRFPFSSTWAPLDT